MCGDSICDSKEQQNPSDCPQDCGPLLGKTPQQITSTQISAQPMQPAQGGNFRDRGEFQDDFGGESQDDFSSGGQLCPDGICDDFEQKNPNACPQDCGGTGSGGSGGRFAQPQTVRPQFQQQFQQPQQQRVSGGGASQACSGCLNNGICDQGECSECSDCLGR